MNRIDNSGQGIASLGRDEDQYMAHVAQGEMVVPPVISQETRQRIEQEMKAAGLSPDEYTVGNGMSINPITGQPEFGWLKKTFKSVKKVAKKAAPILGVASMFIPGLGPAISGMLGAIPGVGGALSTGFNFMTGAGGAGTAGKAATAGKGMFGGTLGPNIKSGLGSFFGKGDGMFGGNIGPSIKSGIASLFGGMGGQQPGVEMQYDEAGNPTGLYVDSVTGETFTAGQLKEAGIMDNSGNIVGSALSNLSKGGGGSFLEKIFGGGNQGGGLGSLLGGNNQGGGMDPKMFALALALGKATKKSAEERAGGLSQTPEVTMDALGRYSMANTLGTGGTREEFGLSAAPKSFSPEVFAAMGGPIDRQYFNQGGLAAVRELDMRDGGESDGPGTGTSDDIPAMLSDGEFVMTAKATKGAGAFNVNKTKSGIELISGGKASRKKGVENMRELMDIFEAI
tara:strand:- start:286 stop:1644 length:1359 start_codon:yes stop_codon:yes gene_type:complete